MWSKSEWRGGEGGKKFIIDKVRYSIKWELLESRENRENKQGSWRATNPLKNVFVSMCLIEAREREGIQSFIPKRFPFKDLMVPVASSGIFGITSNTINLT